MQFEYCNLSMQFEYCKHLLVGCYESIIAESDSGHPPSSASIWTSSWSSSLASLREQYQGTTDQKGGSYQWRS